MRNPLRYRRQVLLTIGVIAALTFVFAIFSIFAIFSRGYFNKSAVRAPAVKVAATIFPVYDIVRQVAGGSVDVVLLLPPGASPHTFEPTPAAVRNIAGAQTLFVIGHGLDDWAARTARGAGVMHIVPVDDGIALRQFSEASNDAGPQAVDPHYWLSIANGMTIARTVATEIERLVPERRDEVERALAGYVMKLEAADLEIRRLLANAPTRRIATFHDAFGYFAAAYSLDVVATFEPFPGKEPGPRFIQEFQRKVRAAGIRVLFSEPQLSVEAIRPIARDAGVTISVLDPIGGVPDRESYIALMLFNAQQVAAALKAPMP
jgi:ABC-type Zn uptake system ZnuABC Zn-binding protein ZnuA